jgi:parvulin-like peptidyl-prolyl isomerase
MAGHSLWAGVACVFVALCASSSQADETWKDAYAKVDGVAILRTAVDAEAKPGLPKSQVLQRHMTMELMRAGLTRAGRDLGAVSAAELDAAMKETEEALKSRGGSLAEILKRSGQTRAQFRADLKLPLAFRGLVRSQLTPAKVKAEFESKKVLLGGEVRISHVLVAIKSGRSRTQAQTRAQTLLEGLGAKPSLEDFAKLASEKSDSPMASLTGGDLDWAHAKDRRPDLPSAVLRAALTQGEVGLVPDPVHGARGVHLVFVSEVRVPAAVTFERYREQLRAALEASEAQRLMMSWRERARIEYAPDAPRPKRRGAPGRAPGSVRRGG